MGNQETSPSIPTQHTEELEMVVEHEELLKVRTSHRGEEALTEVFIKWQRLPRFEATWEEASLLHNRFPDFHLEDKVNPWGRGIVMNQPEPPPVPIVYCRRPKPNSKSRTAADKHRRVAGMCKEVVLVDKSAATATGQKALIKCTKQ